MPPARSRATAARAECLGALELSPASGFGKRSQEKSSSPLAKGKPELPQLHLAAWATPALRHTRTHCAACAAPEDTAKAGNPQSPHGREPRGQPGQLQAAHSSGDRTNGVHTP